eukprot:TRINITY_DN2017_c0_g1_i5.p2 TRINITY_DN2017_c0_g1~~TRINITY_DN2017_c0_g1_i5.p2  ORF type:complete len:354 (+),score=29.89 TRINITY_DN2017_c0_g1_i5:498-1559(+)
MEVLNTYYYGGNLPQRQWHERYVDHIYYTIPFEPNTWSYEFPSEYVGQYGVYEALRYLYEVSGQSHLVRPDSLYVNRPRFCYQTEQLILKRREKFRDIYKIPQDAILLFHSPGNEIEEAAFCLDEIRRGVEEFKLKYFAPSSLEPRALPNSYLYTVLSIQKGSSSEEYIKQQLKEKGWPCQLIVLESKNQEHIDAMCASDYGLIHDGELIGEAAVCHLPTMILFDMRRHHQFYHFLMNRWWNRMTLIANTEIYPEIIGDQIWHGKICNLLGEWYLNPETRTKMMISWEPFIKQALTYLPVNYKINKSRDLILEDGDPYDEFMDPITVMARSALGFAENYNHDIEGRPSLKSLI